MALRKKTGGIQKESVDFGIDAFWIINNELLFMWYFCGFWFNDGYSFIKATIR